MADDSKQTFYSDVDKSRHGSGCLSVIVTVVIIAALAGLALYFWQR